MKNLCDPFDSMSLCMSKGLGAPIGSYVPPFSSSFLPFRCSEPCPDPPSLTFPTPTLQRPRRPRFIHPQSQALPQALWRWSPSIRCPRRSCRFRPHPQLPPPQIDPHPLQASQRLSQGPRRTPARRARNVDNLLRSFTAQHRVGRLEREGAGVAGSDSVGGIKDHCASADERGGGG